MSERNLDLAETFMLTEAWMFFVNNGMTHRDFPLVVIEVNLASMANAAALENTKAKFAVRFHPMIKELLKDEAQDKAKEFLTLLEEIIKR